MLAIVLEQRKAGRRPDAVREVEIACLKSIGLPFSLVRQSSPEGLWALMQLGGNCYVNGVLLAELLIQDAELSKEMRRPSDAVRSFLQAFCLLGESINVLSPDDQPAYRSKMRRIAKELESTGDSQYLREKLKKYIHSLA